MIFQNESHNLWNLVTKNIITPTSVTQEDVPDKKPEKTILTQIVNRGNELKDKEHRVSRAMTYGFPISNHGESEDMKSKIDFYDLRLFQNAMMRNSMMTNNETFKDSNIVNLNTDPSPIRIKKKDALCSPPSNPTYGRR